MGSIVVTEHISVDGIVEAPSGTEPIAEGKPVAGTVTHLRFRVRDYGPGKYAVCNCSLYQCPRAAAAVY